MEELQLVYRPGTLRAADSLSRFHDVLARDGCAIAPSLKTVLSKHQRSTDAPNHFSVASNGIEFDQGVVPSLNLEFLLLKAETPLNISWDEWAEAFTTNGRLTMGWIADSDYHNWQNEDDPLQYSAVGKSVSQLRMKPSNRPPPFDKMMIDTSSNPGRMVLRRGYYEVVGSTMWLGEAFWELTGAQKSEIEKASWLKVSFPVPSILRIEAQRSCFRSDKGEEGELQHRLRSLLFPRSSSER